MKKVIFPLLMYLPIIGLACGTNSCNKPYTPPDITGTWSYQDFLFAIQVNKTVNGYDSELEKKLSEAVYQMDAAVTDPQTIVINPDNTFKFMYAYTEMGTGTYSIDNLGYIYYTFTSGFYPYKEAIALSDGTLMELYLNLDTVKPIFLSFLDVEGEVLNLLFDKDNPIITGMQASTIYRRTK